MAATTLDVSQANASAGTMLDMDGVDATNGNKFKNVPGRTILIIRNGDASSKTVTIPARRTTRPGDAQFPAQSVSDIVLAIAASGIAVLGPFYAAHTDAEGYVTATWSAGTSVTADVVQLP